MAEDKPNPEPSEENAQTPVDPRKAAEAVREVQEAMAILPKKRLGCLGRFAKYGVVVLALFAVFVYWNFLRTPALVISEETTYITEPLTGDGTRVDYIAALEKDLYPPQMKTDDNGYRLMVRALGEIAEGEPEAAHSAQVYEQLGLEPAIEPTMSYIDTHEFLRQYCAAEGLDEEEVDRLYDKAYPPWTLDDLPMMGPWLRRNGPVLDLLGEAVRRPAFCFPLVQPDEGGTLGEAIAWREIHETRSFARMLHTRAQYRIGTGDIDGAIDDVITCNRLGRRAESHGTLIERLVGIAVEGIAAAVGVAAVRESQPTEEQLQRLVRELSALPPRPDMDRCWLTERYLTLDSLQTMAVGGESLAGLFSVWDDIDEFRPPFAEYVSLDWNIIMRRVNAQFDDPGNIQEVPPPPLLSLRNLFIGARSRRVADSVAGLCTPVFAAVHEASRRSHCVGNLRRITLAMLLYERQHGALPPAHTVDAQGNPLHSWRVLLLPYLGEEELHGKLRLDEPWDSRHNRRFHDRALAVYQCPSTELRPGRTTYSVVVGAKTAFRAAEVKSLDDFGMTLMLVTEREQPVCWMDPTWELTEAVAFEGINREEGVDGIGSPHPGGTNAGFRDGRVQFISDTMDMLLLKGLLDGTTEERHF